MLSQDEINSIASEVLPKVRQRVAQEIENSLVAETLICLRSQISEVIKKEASELLTTAVHNSIEGQRSVLLQGLEEAMKQVAINAGERLIEVSKKELESSYRLGALAKSLFGIH